MSAARLDHLRRQERQWFAWLTILHERLTKDGQGGLTEESRRILTIAQKRWLDAKMALGDDHDPEEQSSGERGRQPPAQRTDPKSAPETVPCTGRGDS